MTNGFGSLLRQLRGSLPLEEVADRMGISFGYLGNLETGRRPLDEERTRELLRLGFHLRPRQIDRLILEVHLERTGLKNRKLRQLVIDLAQGLVPSAVRKEFNRLAKLHRPMRPQGHS